ncbi:MAG: hypothetical protein Kow0047_17350 [Anaerolineae bacterium]
MGELNDLCRRALANENAYWAILSEVQNWPTGIVYLHDYYRGPPLNAIRQVDVPEGDEEAFAMEARRLFVRYGRSAQLQVAPWGAREGLRQALMRHGWYRLDDILVMVAERVPDLEGPASKEITVRAAEKEEMAQWMELLTESFELPFDARARKALQRSFLRSPVVSYVAEWRGALVGCAQLFEHSGVSGVYAVGTLPAFRRRGVATALMRHIMMSARPPVALQVTARSDAERLYRRLGFVQVCFQECYLLL